MKGTGRALQAAFVVAPFVAVGLGGRAIVPRAADAFVRRAAPIASVLSVGVRLVPSEETPPATPVEVRPRRDPPAPLSGVSARHPRPVAETAGIVVSRQGLLRLTARQLRAVGWANALNARGAAAGVRLSGVATLGIGLLDGDVVTSIGGRPTPTADQATEAGTAAWLSGKPAAEATIVRGDRTISVTLELPRDRALVRTPERSEGTD